MTEGDFFSALPLFDRRQNVRYRFPLRLRALRAFTVEPGAHRAGVQVAATDDEHGVEAQFVDDVLCVFHERGGRGDSSLGLIGKMRPIKLRLQT